MQRLKSDVTFSLVESDDGITRVVENASGECIHPLMAAWQEATELYLQQSALPERLKKLTGAKPLVCWDVGLGIATNALVMIAETEDQILAGAIKSDHVALELVSFERDLLPLQLAISHIDKFPFLKHPAVSALTSRGQWVSDDGKIVWRLLQGDFQQMLWLAPAPDLILYDPFSAMANPELWSEELLKRVFAACGENETLLITYSTAHTTLSALEQAGFRVETGKAVGRRKVSTLAFKDKQK